MIKAMTLRPCRESTKYILSSFKSESRIYSRTTRNLYIQQPICRQLHSLNTTRSLTSLASSRGRVSWIGTLNDYAANRNTNIKENAYHPPCYPRLSSSYRMSSTSSSSNLSVLKKQGQNEDGQDLNVVKETGRALTAEYLTRKDDNRTSSSENNGDKNKNSDTDTDTVTSITDEGTPQKNSFRSMLRRYGKVFISTYMAVYVTTVLGLFTVVQSGQLDAMYIMSLLTGSSSPADPGGVTDPDTIKEAATAMKEMVEFLESYTLTKPFAPMVEQYPWTGNFAIAWIATKFTEPIRFGVTVVVTPSIAKFVGYKPVPTAVQNGPIDVLSEQKNPSSSSNSEKNNSGSSSAPSSS